MIAEIVGPAGAGKTTILHALAQRSSAIGDSYALPLRQIIPSFLWHTVQSLPSHIPGRRNKQRLSQDSLMTMAYLERLRRIISRSNTHESEVIFFDQGPLYSLTYLRGFGFEGIRSQSLDQWWEKMLLSWSTLIDIVFWLDADDDVLLSRINIRRKWHRAREMSRPEAREFLARYRRTYEQVIDGITSQGHTRVIRLHTDQESIEQVVSRILDVLDSRQSICQS